MKIYDCFMYLDEDIVLDLRLNSLNNYVDKFVIVESKYTHSGKKRELKFNYKNFEKFRNKIIYLVLESQPPDIDIISDQDTDNIKNSKLILNGMRRDFHQRNFIKKGLRETKPDDFILVSDLDEIPKLDNIELNSINKKFVFFKQKMFYYKFNLCSESISWTGTRGCRMKYLKSPQWLRNIKDRSYPLWRLDVFFSKNKYSNIHFIEDGGWHFSYIKSPEDIEKKLKSYAHHREYELNSLGLEKIKSKMNNNESIYNLGTDMKKSKFERGQKLTVLELNKLPNYIQNNLEKYKNWLELK